MSIDPLLWDIMGMPENRQETLSFRAWAAFRCDEIPLHSSIMEVDDAYDFKEVAVRIFNWANTSIEECREELLEKRFSDFVKADQDHIKEGAYVSTLITSLIAEDDLKEAFKEAQSYESGEKNSCSSMNKDGRSFFTHTLEWLSDHDYDANKA